MFSHTRLFKVNEHLYISSAIDGDDMPYIENIGITAIVNLMLDCKYGKSVPQTIRLVHIPIRDGYRIPQETIKHIYTVIDHLKEENKVILIHCAAGVSRSASVVIGQLMRENPKWYWSDAESYLRNIKPVMPDRFVRKSILDYLNNNKLRQKS
jgi:atypical dual specificity phosphatase